MTPIELWDLYGYSESERSAFEYVDEYMERVNAIKESVLLDKTKRRRYALVGLFLLYRRCNHMGIDMGQLDSNEKLDRINEVIGTDIKSTDHYLSLMNINFAWHLNFLKPLSKRLYDFVDS